MLINLRPHHLICNLCFQGKGYNEEFIKNFNSIHQQLNNPRNKIKIIRGIDAICLKCPRKQDCKKDSIAAAIDQSYLRILQLNFGEVVTVHKIKNKIKTLLSVTDFHNACKKCSWKSLGICESVIQNMGVQK